MATSDELYSGLLRQKRSLMLTSLLISAIYVGGAPLETINLLGNELRMPPLLIETAFVVIWVFYLWQYTVARRLRPDQEWEDVVNYRIDRRALPIAEDNAKACLLKDNERKVTLKIGGKVKERSLGALKPNLTVVNKAPTSRKGGYAAEFTIRVHSKDGKQGFGDHGIKSTPFSGWPLRWIRLRAFVYAFFNTRHFSEYILPYLIALLIPAAWLYHYLYAVPIPADM